MAPDGEATNLLPWTNVELLALLKELISHGTELAKVDFKRDIGTGTPEQKAELLKDIDALANTYDEGHYNDFGFLIYGVHSKTIVGAAGLSSDRDKFQNHIEQLLKSYIFPMVPIYAMGFTEAGGEKWGAIVIPPRHEKPYMFFRDLPCADPKLFKRRGDWFVRRGATTDRGGPEDLSTISRRQMRQIVEPLHERIQNLQLRTTRIEDQYNSALFGLVTKVSGALTPSGSQAATLLEEEGPENATVRPQLNAAVETAIASVPSLDLPARLKRQLRGADDALSRDLVAEARALHEHLSSPDNLLPWLPQLKDAAEAKATIQRAEQQAMTLQLALATTMVNDDKGLLDDAVVDVFRVLAKVVDPPHGVTFNAVGEGLRAYPLGLMAYTCFVCGVAKNRSALLQRILEVPIRSRRTRAVTPITDFVQHWYGARGLFNSFFEQNMCEPIAERVRQVLRDRVGELFPALTEPELFFPGEFVLAMVPIDLAIQEGFPEDQRIPLPGLYLYSHEASEVMLDFITDRSDWLEAFYRSPVKEVLTGFQMNASRAVAPQCWSRSLLGFKPIEAYEEAVARRVKKKRP